MTYRARVLVVGSVSIDLTAFAPRRPEPGETLHGSALNLGLGGKGANQAVAAARAGAESYLIGCIGSDHFADVVHEERVAAGVATDKLMSVPAPTGVAHIRVDQRTGENDIVIVTMANDHLTPARMRGHLQDVDAGDVLLAQLETSMDVVEEAAAIAAAAGARLVLDPAPATDVPELVWSSVFSTTPNESEASRLTGVQVCDVPSAAEALSWFVERGVRHPIITLAGQGLLWWDGKAAQHLPAFGVDVVDTTAAGDAFAGALGAQLSGGVDLSRAVRFAAAAGALAVTRAGASASLPTRAQIDSLLTRQGS